MHSFAKRALSLVSLENEHYGYTLKINSELNHYRQIKNIDCDLSDHTLYETTNKLFNILIFSRNVENKGI